MFSLDDLASDRLRAAAYQAAGRVEVREAVGQIYRDLGEKIAQQKPRCDRSGRCCRFEEFGHRLFVTTIELAVFLREVEFAGAAPSAEWNGAGCPFQVGRLCGVHSIRPFGCRIFFCDPDSTVWQQEQYEQFHCRLKELHASLSVPYFYVEWREALRALGIARGACGARILTEDASGD